ncbi:MAG: type II toxin-antitoxin system VapC family toxin [Microthrixaceae bacterium]
MKLVDANVLIYAVNEDAPHHAAARDWLDHALSGAATVGFSWTVLLAFVRLITKAELFDAPLSVDDAFHQVDQWLAAPAAVVIEPTARHADVLRSLLSERGAGGNLVTDAHLAALAVEHRGEIVSFDRDFDRFAGVRWERPGG